MDKVQKYRQLIKDILEEQAHPYNHSQEVEASIICDTEMIITNSPTLAGKTSGGFLALSFTSISKMAKSGFNTTVQSYPSLSF